MKVLLETLINYCITVFLNTHNKRVITDFTNRTFADSWKIFKYGSTLGK